MPPGIPEEKPAHPMDALAALLAARGKPPTAKRPANISQGALTGEYVQQGGGEGGGSARRQGAPNNNTSGNAARTTRHQPIPKG